MRYSYSSIPMQVKLHVYLITMLGKSEISFLDSSLLLSSPAITIPLQDKWLFQSLLPSHVSVLHLIKASAQVSSLYLILCLTSLTVFQFPPRTYLLFCPSTLSVLCTIHPASDNSYLIVIRISLIFPRSRIHICCFFITS